jgi:thioredoxin 1
MILQTNLSHIGSEQEFKELVESKKNLMVCCGRMGPMCIPVYAAMAELRHIYEDVEFYDMAFDAPFAHVIRNLPEARGFMGLPFTVYYKDGKVAAATSSIQSKAQITQVLDKVFR